MKKPGITVGVLRCSLLALSFMAIFNKNIQAQTQEQAAQVINIQDAEWGPPGNSPQFPSGVRTSQLGVHPEHGGPSYFSRFPAGSHFDLHWHTHAEYVVVLSGKGTIVLGEDSHELSPGSYIVIPAKLNHSWDVPDGDTELVILVKRDGPADFNFVD